MAEMRSDYSVFIEMAEGKIPLGRREGNTEVDP
jgi:hypothetical protein